MESLYIKFLNKEVLHDPNEIKALLEIVSEEFGERDKRLIKLLTMLIPKLGESVENLLIEYESMRLKDE